MKKLLLVISLLFTLNLSAATNWGDVSVTTSGCQNFAWDINTDPEADLCFDINAVQSDYVLYNNQQYFDAGELVSGYTTSTYFNHEGNYLLVSVDVFGVPSTQPTVLYKYKTLPLYAFQNIVNYSGGNIINGTRYWFVYFADSDWGPVNSGDIIVKKYLDVVDTLYVK